ncbi:MAG: ribosome-associated translation inhibitor RaiA [Alphaproteobacteria bacterium]|nr:ribosome-associated translation inhibitor RaiA [Alphaproteobacteria bacterium]MDE2337520.1 ribosome-associated translation inhibitor RaiA [Alphaproteobacteria bacterium]
MQLTVKGKHLDVGDSLRAHVEEQLGHTATKYFRDPIEATVIFSKEKNHLFKADISIHVGGGLVLQTHHEADDPYPAFDIAAKAAGKRLSRYKDKLRDHRKTEPDDVTAAAYTTLRGEDDEAEGGNGPAVVAEMETQVLTLAVSDAVMRLELGDLPSLMFRNPTHGGLNMVYRRKDGNIGWVDPDGLKKK